MKQIVKHKLRFLIPFIVFPEYIIDWVRYVKYSGIVFRGGKTRTRARMIAQYHIIEKGLTMPESRPGFGQAQIKELARMCASYAQKYGSDDEQLKHAAGVLEEYLRIAKVNKVELDDELIGAIETTCSMIETKVARQEVSDPLNYFQASSAPFSEFAASRFSIRNYSPAEVEDEKVRNAVRIALKSPSSCNRQGTKVHLEKRPEVIRQILAIQAGSRGFGHLSKAVIVVVGDLGASMNPYDIHMAHFDGGMFAMSLMYGLHHEQLVACPLNCYLSRRKLRKIGNLCNLPKSETPILMMTVGHPKDQFNIALSPRVGVDEVFEVAKDSSAPER